MLSFMHTHTHIHIHTCTDTPPRRHGIGPRHVGALKMFKFIDIMPSSYFTDEEKI